MEFSFPSFYDREDAFNPAVRTIAPRAIMDEAVEYVKKYPGIKKSSSDSSKARMLVIDHQYDFSFEDGSLFVAGRSGRGAMNDSANTAEFIYRNIGLITSITPTLDTHHQFQVFYPSAHEFRDGSHPDTWYEPKAEQFASGELHASRMMADALGVTQDWLSKQWRHTGETLEKTGRYGMILWPEHCMEGSHGHQIAAAINDARIFHGFVRSVMNEPVVKGMNPFTENYSVFKPEVMTTWEGRKLHGVRKNDELLDRFSYGSDMVIVTGEASSHCLMWSVQDLLTEIFDVYEMPELAKNIYILEDCTSPVVVPNGPDHTNAANAAFDEFRNRGVNIVKSTDPIESWPGIAAQIAAKVSN